MENYDLVAIMNPHHILSLGNDENLIVFASVLSRNTFSPNETQSLWVSLKRLSVRQYSSWKQWYQSHN